MDFLALCKSGYVFLRLKNDDICDWQERERNQRVEIKWCHNYFLEHQLIPTGGS